MKRLTIAAACAALTTLVAAPASAGDLFFCALMDDEVAEREAGRAHVVDRGDEAAPGVRRPFAVGIEVEPGVPVAVVDELDVAVGDRVGAGVVRARQQARDIDVV